MGASCTFALLIILLIYAGYKVSVLEGRKKVDILQAVNKNSYDVNYIFGGEQGLNVAIAVFDLYDPTSFGPIDETYGRLSFSINARYINDKGVL